MLQPGSDILMPWLADALIIYDERSVALARPSTGRDDNRRVLAVLAYLDG
jgi:hypothetical protein